MRAASIAARDFLTRRSNSDPLWCAARGGAELASRPLRHFLSPSCVSLAMLLMLNNWSIDCPHSVRAEDHSVRAEDPIPIFARSRRRASEAEQADFQPPACATHPLLHLWVGQTKTHAEKSHFLTSKASSKATRDIESRQLALLHVGSSPLAPRARDSPSPQKKQRSIRPRGYCCRGGRW